jgi:hypothetical protein
MQSHSATARDCCLWSAQTDPMVWQVLVFPQPGAYLAHRLDLGRTMNRTDHFLKACPCVRLLTGSQWGPAASKQEGGQTRHSPVSDLETIDSSKASYAEGNGSSCHCVDALQCSCVEWRKCRHRQQLLEQSLTFSLRVWLAMLTTAGLVASLWL